MDSWKLHNHIIWRVYVKDHKFYSQFPFFDIEWELNVAIGGVVHHLKPIRECLSFVKKIPLDPFS